MFLWRGEPYVVMNGCHGPGRRMFLHDVRRNHTVRLFVDGAADAPGGAEKNWSPYEHGGRLRFVYAFGRREATGVLELADAATGRCTLVHGKLTYDPLIETIGSTPMVQ